MIKNNLIIFLLFSLLLAACNGGGGGGGDGGTSTSTNTDTNNNNTDNTNDNNSNNNQQSNVDPLAQYAWYIDNTGQNSFSYVAGTAGEDLNISQVYTDGYSGQGITVVVSDGRIDVNHEDLATNTAVNSSLHKNYVLSSPYLGNPTSADNTDMHGTAVMGIIGAEKDNGLGSHGIAFNASLVGYNYLSGTSSLSKQIDQANLDAHVYNYSYGNDTCFIGTVDSTYISQIEHAVSTFRSGKGAMFVTSAGNDGNYFSNSVFRDRSCPSSANSTYIGNSNLQQYKSYPYFVTVAASNATGVASTYSTPGSNIWITGAGGESADKREATQYGFPAMYSSAAIVAPDLEGCDKGSSVSSPSYVTNDFETNANGLNENCNYTSTMNGTSSASPTVAAIIALILEANPALTWRDVKLILAATADQIDPYVGYLTHPNGADLAGYEYQRLWIQNNAGYWFNNKYGFGRVNADNAVALAKTYTANLGDLKLTYNDVENDWYYKSGTINQSIPDNSSTGTSNTLTVNHAYEIEAVQVKLNITHSRASDIGIEITSPSGVTSQLMHINSYVDETNLVNLTLLTNAFLMERSNGNWTLKIIDGSSGSTGILVDWELRIWGHDPINKSDTTAPNLVTGLTTNSYFNSTTNSPSISFTNSSSTDVLRYEGCVGTSALNCDIRGWEYIPVSPPFSISDLTLTAGSTYYFNVRVIDTSENVSGVASSSWTVDTTAPNAISGLTLASYHNSTTSSPSISYTASGSSDVAKYEYSIGTSSGGTNIRGWTDNSTNTSLTASGLSLANGNTYYINVRAVDAAGNNSSVITGSWTVDTTVPDAISGLTLASYFNSTTSSPSISYTASGSSDVAKYEYSIGTTSGGVDVRGWTNNSTSTSLTASGLSLTNGNTYYVNVRVVDVTGNNSSVVTASWIADTTAPNPVSSPSIASTYPFKTETPEVSYTASGSSDVAKYQYSIGTTSGGTNVLTWTDNSTNTTAKATGLTLTLGSTYYINLKAIDHAGNESSVVTSSWQVSGDYSQIGTSSEDYINDSVLDGANNRIIVGYSTGSLYATNNVSYSGYVAKYNSSNSLQWSVQFVNNSTTVQSVAVDSSNNVIIGGYVSNSSLFGTLIGGNDVIIAKYDSSGTELWSKQIGTTSNDFSPAVAVDSSDNIIISGQTQGNFFGTNSGESDIYVAKYDSSGTELWSDIIGTTGTEGPSAIAIDSANNIYIGGSTDGSLYGTHSGGSWSDIFLVKLNSSGTEVWSKQFGASSGTDFLSDIAIDSADNVVIVGKTHKDIFSTNSGLFNNGYIIQYNSAGTQQWVAELQTDQNDWIRSVAIDSSDNIYVGGDSKGALFSSNRGLEDFFFAKYNSAGTQQWSKQIGLSNLDSLYSINIDSTGKIIGFGRTKNSLFGSASGNTDIFIFGYSE